MRLSACLIMFANLMPASASPLQANEFEQVWVCSILPGHNLDEVRSAGIGWLKAARAMPGGEGLQLDIRWPIAVPESAESFEFVIRSPSLQGWSKFYEGYDPDSPAGKADEVFATVASCSGSTLWESIPLQP